MFKATRATCSDVALEPRPHKTLGLTRCAPTAGVHSRHHRRGLAGGAHLGAAQVQHRRGVRVLGEEDPGAQPVRRALNPLITRSASQCGRRQGLGFCEGYPVVLIPCAMSPLITSHRHVGLQPKTPTQYDTVERFRISGVRPSLENIREWVL